MFASDWSSVDFFWVRFKEETLTVCDFEDTWYRTLVGEKPQVKYSLLKNSRDSDIDGDLNISGVKTKVTSMSRTSTGTALTVTSTSIGLGVTGTRTGGSLRESTF